MPKHRLLGQRGHTGRDLPVNRDVRDPDLLHWGNERTGFARATIQEAFALEGRDVLHDRRLAGESKMILDFARARGHALLPLFALDKIENASLAIGQHLEQRVRDFFCHRKFK